MRGGGVGIHVYRLYGVPTKSSMEIKYSYSVRSVKSFEVTENVNSGKAGLNCDRLTK